MAKKPELVDKLSINAADRSPLLRAQKETYLQTQSKAEKHKNVAQYMFWGATSLMFGIVTTVIGSMGTTAGVAGLMGGAVAGIGVPMLMGAAAVTALGLAIGNMHFSGKASQAQEKANVLYSDIDSQQQSHRMVQAFAKAQTMGNIEEKNTPFAGTAGTSWADRVGNGQAKSGANWAQKVAAQAQAEEAAVLEVAGR